MRSVSSARAARDDVKSALRGACRAAVAGAALLLIATSMEAQRGRGAAPLRPARELQLERMIRAEDLRGRSGDGLTPLMAGLSDPDAEIRRIAVRGLGRMEDGVLLGAVARLLDDSMASVRAEAANAVAQSVQRAGRAAGDTSAAFTLVDSAFGILRSYARREGIAEVRGVMARSLGRLPYSRPAQAKAAEEEIAGIAGRSASVAQGRSRAPAPVLHGVAHGLFALARARRTLGDLTGPSIAVLRTAAVFGNDSAFGAVTERRAAAEVRRLGWLALNTAGHRNELLIRTAARDEDAQVRRLAVLYLANVSDPFLQREILRRARTDSAFAVRLEWVRMYRQLFAAESCTPLVEAVRDANAHVRLAAIDALGTRCPEGRDVSALLAAMAAAGEARPARVPANTWHERAHAIVALARADSAAATPVVARSAQDPTWQVRLYAARAAELARDAAALRRLARDSIGSVREAAIRGLAAVASHGADDEYVAALASRDAHVVLAAATALQGTPAPKAAVAPLLGALDRLTNERRETSRDPRLAILARLSEMADSTAAGRLANYTRDFDAVIATRAAELLARLTRQAVRAVPERLPVTPIPAGIATGASPRLRITMAGRHAGGTFVVRLDPRTAPASVARIVALARRGYYDGLTWHRVVPNFVVQGGSPAMNEYVGDGPFMRDELGLTSHRRGTVGISTRGRDTGDAQLFINLADNFRLDHEYTVVAEVETGMDIVDAILEGDVMERVEVVPGS